MNNPYDCLRSDDTDTQLHTPSLDKHVHTILEQDQVTVEDVNGDSSSSDDFGDADLLGDSSNQFIANIADTIQETATAPEYRLLQYGRTNPNVCP